MYNYKCTITGTIETISCALSKGGVTEERRNYHQLAVLRSGGSPERCRWSRSWGRPPHPSHPALVHGMTVRASVCQPCRHVIETSTFMSGPADSVQPNDEPSVKCNRGFGNFGRRGMSANRRQPEESGIKGKRKDSRRTPRYEKIECVAIEEGEPPSKDDEGYGDPV